MMRSVWVGLLVLAFCMDASSRVQACKGSQLLYEDNFQTLDPSYGQPTDQIYVKEDKLVIQSPANKSYTAINQTLLFSDVDLCVKMSLAKSENPSHGGGIVFWAKDSSEYYYLLVNGDGWFCVKRWVSNRILDPVAWRETPALKKGVGEWNHVRILTQGNQATLYFNDTEILSFKGQPPQGGFLIGFQGNSPENSSNTWEFSELKVTQ